MSYDPNPVFNVNIDSILLDEMSSITVSPQSFANISSTQNDLKTSLEIKTDANFIKYISLLYDSNTSWRIEASFLNHILSLSGNTGDFKIEGGFIFKDDNDVELNIPHKQSICVSTNSRTEVDTGTAACVIYPTDFQGSNELKVYCVVTSNDNARIFTEGEDALFFNSMGQSHINVWEIKS